MRDGWSIKCLHREEIKLFLLILTIDRWITFFFLSSVVSWPLWAISYRKFCMCSMFIGAWNTNTAFPLFTHTRSICFMTHESQQVWSSVNRHICTLVEGLLAESYLSPQCTHSQTLGRLAALWKWNRPACQWAPCHQSRWAQQGQAAEHACLFWTHACWAFVSFSCRR